MPSSQGQYSQHEYSQHEYSRGVLLAGANRARQSAIVDTVGGVPQGLSEFNPSAKNFNLIRTPCWRIRGHELLIHLGDEVFIVTVPQDSFKNVLALAHKTASRFTLSACPLLSAHTS